MDRALKERTVGAIVLMVFIVLVVPVFLDGPEPETPVVSESVTLPGQNGQPRRRQTIVLERDRTEPVPAGTAAAEPAAPTADAPPAADDTDVLAPAVSEPSQATVEAPAETPAAAARDDQAPPEREPKAEQEPEREPPAAAAAAQSATGMWAVQLGSFSNRANAERLASELRSKGYAAFLSQLSSSGGPLHRVRIGPQKDRDSAEAMSARLAADGHRGQVVPHP